MLVVVVVLPQIIVPFLPGPVEGDLELARSDRPGVRVLFVGNALVSQNSMITMMRELAEGDPDAPPFFTVHYAPRGSTLDEAVREHELTNLLDDERWDYVVLQEHSQVVSRPGVREKRMLRAATRLDTMARQAGARTVLYLQPGYRSGDDENLGGDTFNRMQRRVVEGYSKLNGVLRALPAPVAHAWAEALLQQPELDLWHRDGVRPSEKGSYLAACVFYAVLSHRDPGESGFTGPLDRAQARSLQETARRTVAQFERAIRIAGGNLNSSIPGSNGRR